jgi:FtsH-binding integral membrane protein
MRPSPWSLTLLMLVLGVSLAYFARQPGMVTPPTTYISAGALILGGVVLAVHRPVGLRVALIAALLTVALSLASFVVRRELVPTPPITLLMGLLVTARVLLARSIEKRDRERRGSAPANVPGDDPL